MLNKTELKDEIKQFVTTAGSVFHKIGFWFIIVIMLGFFLGGYAMQIHQNIQMKKAILLGGLVSGQDNKVYNITERIK